MFDTSEASYGCDTEVKAVVDSREAYSSVVVVAPRGAQYRRALERHIEAAYRDAFACRLATHYPTLLGVIGPENQVRSAVGFRLARDETLFLESYLNEPIERAVRALTRYPVARAGIAEIGSLAAGDRGAALILFESLASHLAASGCKYAAATATAPLRRIFRSIGFQTVDLADADAARLPAGAGAWGRYYDLRPRVVCGQVRAGLAVLHERTQS